MSKIGEKRPYSSPAGETDKNHAAKRMMVSRMNVKRETSSLHQLTANDNDGHVDDMAPNTVETQDQDTEGDVSRIDLDDDTENLKAYERSKARMRRYLGAPSEAGVLKSITLVNFMCHQHLTVDFCARMNFLVGHNGSGKSAILTAIAVALGAKAAVTGRGQGVKDLIMRDCDKAIISLTLSNNGFEAYRPDVYDPDIVIERMFDKHGGSSYKFRGSKDGKIISNTRDELTQICSVFNIDIDSPLTILTQDAAKSFLATTDEHKLYAFFLKGTSLASLAEQYSKTRQTQASIEFSISRSKESLPDYQTKVDRLKRDMESAKAAGNLKVERDEIEKMLAWAYVTQKEEECKEAKLQVEDLNEKIQKIDEKLAQVEAERDPTEAAIGVLESDIKSHELQGAPILQAMKTAKQALEMHRRHLRTAEEAVFECKETAASKEAEIVDVNRQLEIRSRGDNSLRDPHEIEIRQQLQKAENILSNMRRQLPSVDRKAADAKAAHDLSVTKMDTLYSVQEDRFKKLKHDQEVLDNIESQTKDRLRAFGKDIHIVMDGIAKAKWHHSPPIGPLGRYVHLQDQRYKDAIQTLIGGSLCGFAVRDKRDRFTLQQILENSFRQGYRPGTGQNSLPLIFTHSGDVYDYSHGDLSGIAETVLSKLGVANEQVLRVLINAHHIEKVIVAPDQMKANEEISRVLAMGVPEVTVISANNFQQSGRQFGFRNSGPLPTWRGNSLLVKDVASEIESMRAKVQASSAEYLSAQTVVKEQAIVVKQLESDMGAAMREVTRVTTGIPKAQKRIEQLADELAELQPTNEDVLVHAKSDYEKELGAIKRELELLEVQLQETRTLFDSASENYQDLERRHHSFIPEKQSMAAALSAIMLKQTKLVSDKSHWTASRNRAQNECHVATENLKRCESDLEDWTVKATSFCKQRVATTQSLADIENRHKALNKAIVEANKSNIDINIITPELNLAIDGLNKLRGNIRDYSILNQELKKSIERRQTRWQELRHHIAVRARTAFIANIHRRGFEGRLVFNHDSEQLSIRVQTTGLHDSANGAAQTRFKAPINLSGGERSFSTVSFLLALWDTAPSSIRCLDEWDVFLDMINRQLAAKLLIDGARESDGKQYLLITPQDMGGMQITGPDTRVIRLSDPTRNQRTLHINTS